MKTALAGLALAAALLAGALSAGGLVPRRAAALKHSINDVSLTWRMPLSSALVSESSDLAPDPYGEAKRKSFNVLSAALCFYIAAVSAGSFASGGLAAGGALLLAPADAEQALLAFLLLAALAWGVRRSGRETAGNAAFTGLLLAAALMVRSSAVSFPLVWAFHELLFTGGSARDRAGRAGALLAAAFLPLLPWAFLNYRVSGSFWPFESGRSLSNVVTGALGGVYTVEGDYRGLAGLAPGQSAAAWAAAAILRSPAAYAFSVLRRAWHAFLFMPWLVAAAAAVPVIARWRRRALLPLLLAAGFAFSHVLMAIEPRYFEPLWPLLCCVAALPAGFLLRREDAGRSLRPLLAACAAAALGLLFFAESASLRALFGLRPPAAALAGAEAAGDPYLLRFGATRALYAGDRAGLLRYTAAAARAGLQAARAVEEILVSDGRFPPLTGRWLEGEDQYILKALRQLELGRNAEASGTLALAASRSGVRARGPEHGVDLRLAASDKGEAFRDGLVTRCLLYWPPEKRGRLLAGLRKVLPLSPEESLREAELLRGSGCGGAEAALGAAAGKLKSAADKVRAMELLVSCGRRDRAAALFRELPVPRCGEAGEYLLAAVLAGETGAALERLAGSGSGCSEAAGAYASDPERASCLAFGADASRDRGFLTLAAASELRAGLRREAAALARCGLAAARGPDDTAALALVLQDAGAPGEAARRLDEAARGEPRYLYDAGVAYVLAGEPAAARSRLEAFLKRSPGDAGALAALAALRGGPGKAPSGARRDSIDNFEGK